MKVIRVALLLFSFVSLSLAGEIRWASLEGVVKNKRVEIILPEGSKVAGKVRSVDGDAIFLTDAPGERRIPRAGLKDITIIRNGKLWRTLFVTWGGLTILGGVVETGGKGIAAGAAVGLGGNAVGDYLDRRKTVLTLMD